MGLGRYISILHLIKFDHYKYKYKKKNKGNNTIPGNYFDYNKVNVGDCTYGTLNVVDYSKNDYILNIGAYCSISGGVHFLLGGEHMINTITTFPFKVYKWGEDYEASSKGNITIGDDVWIGQNAIIMSGVTVGQGAIIGAGTIVTKDVSPYSIVVGNPSREIGKRFSEALINRLLSVNIKELFDSFLEEDKQRIYSSNENDIAYLIEKYLNVS